MSTLRSDADGILRAISRKSEELRANYFAAHPWQPGEVARGIPVPTDPAMLDLLLELGLGAGSLDAVLTTTKLLCEAGLVEVINNNGFRYTLTRSGREVVDHLLQADQ